MIYKIQDLQIHFYLDFIDNFIYWDYYVLFPDLYFCKVQNQDNVLKVSLK